MSVRKLDQIAWDYLMGSPRDQATWANILVNAGAAAVFPLLHAGLRIARDFNPLQGVVRSDREVAESTWVYQIAEPMLESICAIVNTVGQPAYDALCRALWEQDERLKVLAALVLLQEGKPSARTTKQVQDAFNIITRNDRDKKYFMQSGIFVILSHVLARGGDPKHQLALQQWATEHQMSVEQVIEASRNSGLIYLIR